MAAEDLGSVIFKERNQCKTVLQALYDLKQSSTFCDVILKVCEKDIYAHSNVLAAASPYFSTVLQNDAPRVFSQKNPQIIEIQIQGNDDLSCQYYDVVNTLVDYMYSGEMKADLKWLEKLREMAVIMGLGQVIVFCDGKAKSKTRLGSRSKRSRGQKRTAEDVDEESDFSEFSLESSDEETPIVRVSKRGRPLKKRIIKDLGSQSLGYGHRKTTRDLDRQESPMQDGEDQKLKIDAKHFCEQCNYSTSRMSHFKRHLRQTHSSRVSNDNTDETNGEKTCDECEFTTDNSDLFRQHLLEHTKAKYKCKQCDFVTPKRKELTNHTREHQHAKNTCSFCYLQLESQELLTDHLKLHTGEYPYVCPVCSAKFKTRNQFKLHYPKHLDTKPFVCEVCNAAFKWKHALKNHMIVHSDSKNHLCDTCGYATAHKSQLKAHRLIHTGDTFKCSYSDCKFQATKRQNLKYHLLTHTGEKPHQCEICGQSFSLVKNMRRHMMLHSNNAILSCELCQFTTHRSDKLREHQRKQHDIGKPPEKRFTVEQAVLASKDTVEQTVHTINIETQPVLEINQSLDAAITPTITSDSIAMVSQVLNLDTTHPIILQTSGQTYTLLQTSDQGQQRLAQTFQTMQYPTQ